MNANKVIVIFSGYNDRAVISFIRTLEKKKIRYAVIARDNSDLIFKTKYKDNVLITRSSPSLEINFVEDALNFVKKKFNANEVLLAPSTETLIRFFLKYQAELNKINAIMPVVSQSLYELISNKKSFSDLCLQYDINVPKEFADYNSTIPPFVAKPKEYESNGNKIYNPVLIFNKKQKDDFAKCHDITAFYYQEYIEGKSKYLLYYFDQNGIAYKFSQENIMQQGEGKSMLAAKTSDYHLNEISVKFEHLFKSENFFGLVMVELKIYDNKDYMIEANPRFWGPSQLFVDANANFFEALLYDYGFIYSRPSFKKTKDTSYFWFGGFYKSITNGQASTICTYEDFLKLDKWITNDVYKREDTIDVFLEELTK